MSHQARRRAVRTVAQFVAALPATALVNDLFGGLDPSWLLVVQAAAQAAVTSLHNWLEDLGRIRDTRG